MLSQVSAKTRFARLIHPIIPYFQGGLFPIIQCRGAGGVCDLNDAQNLIARVLQFLWGFGGTVAVLVAFWGAYLFITSAGDPAKAESAKKTLFAGLIGMLIVIFGYAFTRWFASQFWEGSVPLPVTPKLG
jgi:hypothetical protein